MSRWEVWSFGILNGIVAVTGAAYYYMKVVLVSEDPFAVVNHPWQPGMLAAHIVVAPLATISFGMLFRSHVLPKLVSRVPAFRRSGWSSLGSFLAMTLSGYLLQVASVPSHVRVLSLAHIATGTVFVASYSLHLILARGPIRQSLDAQAGGPKLSRSALPR